MNSVVGMCKLNTIRQLHLTNIVVFYRKYNISDFNLKC